MKCNLMEFKELTTAQLYEILKLRTEVFVVEQDCAYQDLDDKDQSARHMFLEDNGEIIAVLRILPENVAYREMAIGRLVVKEPYRGKGISRKMMNWAMEYITDELGKDKIRLSGQAYLTDFYQSLGFKKVSEMYLEDGIEHFEFLYETNLKVR